MPLILEGLLTTLNADGTTNVAAQGPIVVETDREFLFRPYQGSTSRDNLLREQHGVFQTLDDVLLLARTVVAGLTGIVTETPELIPSVKSATPTLEAACRAWEFEIVEVRSTNERAELTARVTHARTLRASHGWNRAQFAVIETAILATRLRMLDRDEVRRDLTRWERVVEKTAGPREATAFAILLDAIKLQYRRIDSEP
ncbi:MAG: DUF447 family protein [Pirellulales bacterium]